MREGFISICITTDVYAELAERKVHPRQAFHEVVAGLLHEARRRR